MRRIFSNSQEFNCFDELLTKLGHQGSGDIGETLKLVGVLTPSLAHTKHIPHQLMEHTSRVSHLMGACFPSNNTVIAKLAGSNGEGYLGVRRAVRAASLDKKGFPAVADISLMMFHEPEILPGVHQKRWHSAPLDFTLVLPVTQQYLEQTRRFLKTFLPTVHGFYPLKQPLTQDDPRHIIHTKGTEVVAQGYAALKQFGLALPEKPVFRYPIHH